MRFVYAQKPVCRVEFARSSKFQSVAINIDRFAEYRFRTFGLHRFLPVSDIKDQRAAEPQGSGEGTKDLYAIVLVDKIMLANTQKRPRPNT